MRGRARSRIRGYHRDDEHPPASRALSDRLELLLGGPGVAQAHRRQPDHDRGARADHGRYSGSAVLAMLTLMALAPALPSAAHAGLSVGD